LPWTICAQILHFYEDEHTSNATACDANGINQIAVTINQTMSAKQQLAKEEQK
jgi:hypothetical protein